MVGYVGSSSSEATVKVMPELRIVPCGGNGERLKATVLISPVPVANEKGTLTLNHWPRDMAELLKANKWMFDVRLQLIHRPPKVNGSTPIVRPDPSMGQMLDHLPPKAQTAFSDADRLDALTELWRRSIAPPRDPKKFTIWDALNDPPKTPWESLAAQLKASSKPPISLGHIGGNGQLKVAIESTMLGDQGQLVSQFSEGEKAKIHSVLAVPHANLAIALEQKRAAELLKSMAESSKTKPSVTGARPAEPPEWKKMKEELKLTVDTPTDLTDAQRTAQYQAAVKDHHVNRLKDLQKNVNVVRDDAKKLYEAATLALERNVCRSPGSTRNGWPGYAPRDLTDDITREEIIAAADAVEEHATWPQHSDLPFDKETPPDHDPAGLAFFTLQSTPSLSRAFLLAVDLEFDRPEFLPIDKSYAYLTVSLPDHPASEELVTLCKIERRAGQDKKPDFWHFWPTTMAELEYWLEDKTELCGEDISQHDAVMVMSGGWDLDQKSSQPRFDLTCLDVNAALTSNRQRRLALEDSKGVPAKSASETDAGVEQPSPTLLPWSDLDSGATLVSAGLTLLQRSAQADVIAKIAARVVKTAGTPCGATVTKGLDGCTRVVIDADDLTVGTRLVVGRRKDALTTDWRPLMGRQIRFGTTGAPDLSKDVVERVLADLVGKPGSPARTALDSAFTTMGNRVLPLPIAGDRQSEIVVDEAYATWDGSPMGVDCATRSDFKDVVEDSLAFGRELSLPESGDDRPHALRYGHPYRMAMLPVYSGGMSLPMAEFPQDTDEACVKDPLIALLHYPPSCPRGGNAFKISPYVRMLRHARIAPPAILLPAGHATRVNGPVGTDVARDLVVRSLASDDEKTPNKRLRSRARPTIAQRLIVVPTLSLEEAARHGMLESQAGKARPRGAYAHVSQDPATQAFPVTLTRFQKGIGERKYFLDCRIDGDKMDGRLYDSETAGDAVWRPRGKDGPTTYFPDPTARYLALRQRVPGRDTDTIHAWYDLWPGGIAEAEPRPVLLTLSQVRKGKNPGLPPSGKLPLCRISPNLQGEIRGSLGRQVFDLEIVLRKGEVFDLDLWWVPDAFALAHDFALPQSLGVLLAACENGDFACNAEDIAKAFGNKGLDDLACALAKNLPLAKKPVDLTYVAPGGVAAPSTETLKALACAIVERHKTQPLPELASVQRLTLTHAVNRLEDVDAPILAVPGTADPFPDSLLPVPPSKGDAVPLYARRHAPGPFALVAKDLAVASSDGETGLVIGGTVEIDRDLVDSLEIWASVVLPDSTLFDDDALGRSLALRQSGTWPTRIGGPDPNALRNAESIFGFKVFADGQVEHAQREVLLLRIDDLQRGAKGGKEKLDLLPYFLRGKDDSQGGRVVRRHQFTDGKARVLQIWVNALCRTSDRMTTVDRVAFVDDPWVDPARGFGFILGDMVDSAALPALEQQRISRGTVRVVMPASIRPFPCDARSPFPVFNESKTVKKGVGPFLRLLVERTASIRIPLGRGWYSSGQDERVGFVLWPPRLLSGKGPAGTVPIPGRGDVAFDGFRDIDLGPGGRFVSRRGGDPVRAGHGEERDLFLRGEDFLDLGTLDSDLAYVDDVLMPLAKPPEAGTTAAASADLALPLLRVALVTAQPRFDPEREEWYVDLALRPGMAPETFVRLGMVRYQPHTDPARRCSLPVVQWTQPLPDRRLVVSQDGQGGLKVQVRGDAPSRQNDGILKGKPQIATDRQPQMKVTLLSETLDTEGRRLLRTVTELTAEVGKAPLDGKDRWEWTAPLSKEHLDKAQATGPDGSAAEVMIYVEEVELFRPAEYPIEPLTPDQARDVGRTAETGPRYAQSLSLKPILDSLGPKSKPKSANRIGPTLNPKEG
jgi:hypothetical protein